MPITLPNLDDRRFADLVEEGRTLIPNYAPDWTNHNPSDPGITLIELFAYLTEILIYRLNRVTDANKKAFLKLIAGQDWEPAPGTDLNESIRQVVLQLRVPNRAVTTADYESLVLMEFSDSVVRAHCQGLRNLEPDDSKLRNIVRPGHMSVTVVSKKAGGKKNPKPSPELLQQVAAYLDPRRLITTRLHVVGPRYVAISINLSLILKPDALEQMVRSRVRDTLDNFFDPLKGGHDGTGWPFGRNIYVSEIYQLLDQVEGVDFVTRAIDPQTTKPIIDPNTSQPYEELVTADPTRLLRRITGELVAVKLYADELVDVDNLDDKGISIISPLTLT